ncbi:hypothetical protein VNO80_21876 [Phaseolus coccineus]|uniref:RRM domain-containing protein n=1 Tax=Phaseolus coccineus TaxID=3886 RepID=A0AAN9QUF1_PHACN
MGRAQTSPKMGLGPERVSELTTAMAFFGRIGNLLRQTASRQVSSELRSSPSFFQAIRCLSSAPSSKLFIGGVSFSTDEQSLREAFSKYGEVVDARIIMDRETGRSRGFGFVTYTSVEEASSAIQALDGQDLHGRPIRVNYANERTRGYGGGGGYGGAYGGGGYGGGGGGYGGGGGGYGGNAGGGYGGYGGNAGGGYGGGSYGGNAGGGYGGGGGYGAGGNLGDSGSGNNYPAADSFGASGGSYSGNFGDAGRVGNHESSTGFGSSGYDGSAVDGNAAGTGTSFGGGSGQFDSKASSNGDEDYRDDNDDADNFAKRA